MHFKIVMDLAALYITTYFLLVSCELKMVFLIRKSQISAYIDNSDIGGKWRQVVGEC